MARAIHQGRTLQRLRSSYLSLDPVEAVGRAGVEEEAVASAVHIAGPSKVRLLLWNDEHAANPIPKEFLPGT